MSNYGDPGQSKLRAAIAAIEHQHTQAPPTPAMRSAWAELVQVLAVEPAPATRECPTCHGIGMRAASRCGQCWSALAPLPNVLEG